MALPSCIVLHSNLFVAHIYAARSLLCTAAMQIKVEAVRMRYRPGLPLVLKGLSCDIPGGSTCGVVGRTGARQPLPASAYYALYVAAMSVPPS